MSYSKTCSTFAIVTALALSPSFNANADGDFTITVGGRAQIDYNVVDADTANLDVNASEARRIRLNVSGKYGSNLKYKAELNTNSSGEINMEDVYLDFKLGESPWGVKAGQFKTPNSLDEQTSSRFISTLERAAFTDAFEFNRRVGIMAHTKGDAFTFGAGIFGENLDNSGNQEGFALAARGTFAPIQTDETILHLGASARYRETGDSTGDFRYRQRPYAHIPGRVISTGSIASSDTFYGVEAAGLFGPFWASGEYGLLDADATAGSDPSLEGYYLEAGYFFGGTKTYKDGKFSRPKVTNPITDGGTGALSLVVRYDGLDLSDSTVNGGELDTFIVSADWWPTKNTRIGLNYFNGDVVYGASTSGLDSAFADEVLAGTVDDNVSGMTARLQFDF